MRDEITLLSIYKPTLMKTSILKVEALLSQKESAITPMARPEIKSNLFPVIKQLNKKVICYNLECDFAIKRSEWEEKKR